MPVLRPLGHEDRISIVDHLDELRSRLIICVVALVVMFAFTYWQNAEILRIVNQPLVDAQKQGQLNPQNSADESIRFEKQLSQAVKELAPATAATAKALEDIASDPGVSAGTQEQATAAADSRSSSSSPAACVPTSYSPDSAGISPRTSVPVVPVQDRARPATCGTGRPTCRRCGCAAGLC